MAFVRSVTVSRVLGLSLLLAGVACTALTDNDVSGSQDDALEAQFNKNNVVSDVEFQTSTVSVADVQRFLVKTPYGTKSVLAAYTENGKTAAQILHEESVKYRISPIAMLARVQTEQGLISKTTATKSQTDIAFGCGCPDSASCAAKYYGLANQAACAAGSLRWSIDRQTAGSTISGWRKGVSKKTLDQLDIVPENAATAALYTYTPWVGEAGGGKTGVGGTSLYFKVLKRFTDATVIAKQGGTATGDASVADTGVSRPDAAIPARDAGPVRDGGPCGCTNPLFPICDTSTNQCVGCLQDSQCAGESPRTMCDTTLKKCVECTTGKTANCDVAGSGSACLANKTCGCDTDTECGTATSGRACGAAKVCQAGCRGTGGNRCPVGQTCSSTTAALGTCSAGSVDASVPDSAPPPPPPPPNEDASAPPVTEPPTTEPGPDEATPDLEGGKPTPTSNSAPPPQRNEGSNLGSGAGPDLDLGKKPAASSGCTTSGTTRNPSHGAWLAALGILVLAGGRGRRRDQR